VITETLWERHCCRPSFSDSALQSCITYPVCRCQRTSRAMWRVEIWMRRFPFFVQTQNGLFLLRDAMVGVTGFEPVTLRLSSACSNQLSYTPMPRCARELGYRKSRSKSLAFWWRHGDSNPRPIACKATALPTELCPQG
jgi:hypothetical protein